MKALLLIILLGHGGYWFGGAENTVAMHWSAQNMPAATVSWQLSYGTVLIASGDVDLPAGEKAATLKLKMPAARTLSVYTWRYRLKDRATGKELETGERSIFLVPDKLLEEQARRTKGKSVVVIDGKDGGLFTRLKESGVEMTRVDGIGDLQLRPADIILVGEDQMPANEATQDLLRERAKEGASVMVFAQRNGKQLAGIPLRARPVKDDLAWREDHGLFENLAAAALNELVKETPGDMTALALPANAAVLELGYWRRESPGDEPAPLDALVATETVGKGRLVYWQIPLADWKDDPRVRMVLANSLDYLLTRPEPTLPPTRREHVVSGTIEKNPIMVSGEKQ